MALGTLVLSAAIMVLLVVGQRPVYTVPQVLAGLTRNPRAWAGRTVLVWGTALRIIPGCQHGQWCASGLYKPHSRRPGPILLLEPGPPDPWAAPLRNILNVVPLVGSMVPGPQHLLWQQPATYRLLFQVVPHTTCDSLPCINALLIDAAL